MPESPKNFNCFQCSYPLVGLTDALSCPECGTSIAESQEVYWSRRSAAAGVLRMAVWFLPFVSIGLIIASVAVATDFRPDRRIVLGLLVLGNLVGGLAYTFAKRLYTYTRKSSVGGMWSAIVMGLIVVWDLILIIVYVYWNFF